MGKSRMDGMVATREAADILGLHGRSHYCMSGQALVLLRGVGARHERVGSSYLFHIEDVEALAGILRSAGLGHGASVCPESTENEAQDPEPDGGA